MSVLTTLGSDGYITQEADAALREAEGTAIWQKFMPLELHRGGVLSVAWSPNTDLIASSGFDRTIRIWDAGSFQQRAVLTGHAGYVYSVAWSPDGKYIVSGSGSSTDTESTIKIWDVEKSRNIKTL